MNEDKPKIAGGGGKDYEGGNVADFTPAGAVPLTSQATIDYFKSKDQSLPFTDPQSYLDWVYGGKGSVVPSSNVTQDPGQYYAPAGGDIYKTANIPLSYDKPEALTDQGWLIPLGVAGAGLAYGGLPGVAGGAGTAAFDAGGAITGATAPAVSGAAELAGPLASPEAVSSFMSTVPQAADPLAWTGAEAGNVAGLGSAADTSLMGYGTEGTLSAADVLGGGGLPGAGAPTPPTPQQQQGGGTPPAEKTLTQKAFDLISKNPLATLGIGANLASQFAQKGSASDLVSKLEAMGGPSKAVSDALLSQYQSGTLNPSSAYQIKKWQDQATAAAKSYYARAGMGDSSAAMNHINQINAQAQAMTDQALQNVLQSGLAAAGVAQGPLSAAATAQAKQDQTLAANLAAAVGAIGKLQGAQSTQPGAK